MAGWAKENKTTAVFAQVKCYNHELIFNNNIPFPFHSNTTLLHNKIILTFQIKRLFVIIFWVIFVFLNHELVYKNYFMISLDYQTELQFGFFDLDLAFF